MSFIVKIIFIISLSFSVFSQSSLQVNTLDEQRNCWYHHYEENNIFQVADFAGFSPMAYRIDQSDLSQNLKAAISEISQKELYSDILNLSGNYEVYLHCGAQGHMLVVNSYASKPAFIFMTKLDNLAGGTIASNIEKDKRGFQLGVSPHSFIIKKTDGIEAEELIKLLKAYYPNLFASLRFIPHTSLGRFRVTPKWYFKVNEVIEMLKNNNLAKYIEYIEPNAMQSFVGESGFLFESQF